MATAPLQLLINLYDGSLEQGRVDYEKYRKVRLQPTIALVREYCIAVTVAAGCTPDLIKDDDTTAQEQLDFIIEHIQPLWEEWMRIAHAKVIDFGWSAWEVEYEIKDGKTVPKCVDALKNDWTWARYYLDAQGRATRDFAGLKTVDAYTGHEILLDPLHGLFCSFDEEGLGGYGEPILKRLITVYDSWLDSMESFTRYNRKMAGGMLLITAPVGNSLVQGVDSDDGVQQEVDNQMIAARLAQTIKTNGAFTMPAQQQLAGMQEAGWKIEYLESKGSQQDFVDGLSYLDKLFIRAFGIADRAVLEADFGSRADSETATDAAILNLQGIARRLTNFFNDKIVAPVLEVNFGEVKAKLKSTPIGDDNSETIKELLKITMADPGVGPIICERMDVDDAFDKLGIKLKPEEELVINDPEVIAAQRAVMPPAPGEEEETDNDPSN